MAQATDRQYPEYRGYRRGGVRLREQLHPVLGRLRDDVEPRLDGPLAAYDRAHVILLLEAGWIDRGTAASLLRVLSPGDEGDTKRASQHAGEAGAIAALGERIGGQINLGRSSGDLGATAKRMAAKAFIADLTEIIADLIEDLIVTAGRHVESVMPGYTQVQKAHPTTLAHWLLAFAHALGRDADRLDALYERFDQCPAGSAILSGTPVEIDRERAADLLGFQRPAENTFDAVQSHDVDVELVAVLGLLLADVASRSTDLLLWHSEEFGFVEAADRFCGTSSIMMQKKNPYLLEQVRGLATHVMGLYPSAVALHGAGSGWSTLEWNATSSAVYRAMDAATDLLPLLGELIATMRVDVDRMRESAESSWMQATDVALALVRDQDVSWRTAHQILGITVRMSEDEGWGPRELTTARLAAAAREYFKADVTLTQDAIDDAMDPVVAVSRRTVYGGPGGSAIPGQLASARALHSRVAERARAWHAAIAAQKTRLDSAVARVLNEKA